MMHPRILVVDDSIAIVSSLTAILKMSGFEVDSAFNASDALRKVHTEAFDLVICDIEMPGITGLDFLSRIRTDFDRDVDVILMTGYLDRDYFLEAIRLGASDFISKPIDTKQIVRSIQTLQERKRNRLDYSEFYTHLDSADFNFVFDPKHFSKFAISKVFNSFLRSNFRLKASVINELLICVDEMVYNAFIHGTLSLSIEERKLDHDNLQKLIAQKLHLPEIAKKRLRFAFTINHESKMITIAVEDDGDGFDHEGWREKVTKEPKLNLEEHGRGLSMLYHLADNIRFEKGGRYIAISKHLSPIQAS